MHERILQEYKSFAHTYLLLSDLLPGLFGSGSERSRRHLVNYYLQLLPLFEGDVFIQEYGSCFAEVPKAFYTLPENEWLL